MDHLGRLIDLALDEELGAAGDVTTLALVPAGVQGRAELVAKEPMAMAGCAAFAHVFQRVDPQVLVSFQAFDGAALSKGPTAC